MCTYWVVWANILEKFDDFEKAMNHAEAQTKDEEYCDTAMIISISEDEEANLTTADIAMVTWLYGATWVVNELGVF